MPFVSLSPGENSYAALQGDPADNREDGTSDTDFAERLSKSKSKPLSRFCISFFVLLQSLTVVILGTYITKTWKVSDLACATQLSPYSPYLESGDLEYEHFQDQNHLMQPSPYRGHPTPEVEQAWIKLWRLPTIHFPESKMVALNKTPVDQYAHVSTSSGGGVLGFLNVFHQLHCLNLVRQYTYRDQYDYSNTTAFRAPEEIVRGHVDHCIETIRKAIMCTSDVTPVVFEKDSSRPSGSKSDFNIQRSCRNYRKIQRWAAENRAEIEGHDLEDLH